MSGEENCGPHLHVREENKNKNTKNVQYEKAFRDSLEDRRRKGKLVISLDLSLFLCCHTAGTVAACAHILGLSLDVSAYGGIRFYFWLCVHRQKIKTTLCGSIVFSRSKRLKSKDSHNNCNKKAKTSR